MTELNDAALDAIADRAASIAGIASVAIFAVERGTSALRLAAAAGIEGPALERLTAAVRDPEHPVARALSDESPTIDVLPTAPGGPRLRSHIPLRVGGAEDRDAIGVLAVAHDLPLAEDQRRQLIDVAAAAEAALGRLDEN